jgi:alpha-ketoglutarate-dependent taurine dioxygenase
VSAPIEKAGSAREGAGPRGPRALPAIARKGVDARGDDWVRFGAAAEGAPLPWLARPALAGVDLAEWAGRHRDLIEARLHEHGALLFRGFDVRSAEAFEPVVRALAGEPLAYEERSSPRSRVQGHIYTSTDHPPSEAIFLHNEQSYNLTFPLRLVFGCITAAPLGGETPLADTRRVYRRIEPDVRARFIEQGYLYVRNFDGRFGLTWQGAFQTDDRAEVEAYCRRHAIEFEWRAGGRLKTRQRRRAAGLHPVTGEPVWFNHATFFHVSTLPAAVATALLAELGEDALPNATLYGDGASIEAHVIEGLRAAYHAETVAVPWREGDVLLVDNMLAAHGRTPFAGPRRVLTALTRPFAWAAVPPAG